MAKWIFFTVLLLIGVIVAAIATFAGIAPTQIEGTNIRRTVTSNLLWGKQPVTSTVGINLTAFTACTQEKAALDIVILIDASPSMDGDPLNNALDGARAFIDLLDFTRHRVAIGVFASTVYDQIGLTDQEPALLALLARTSVSNDGTSLAAPLSFAQTELESRRRQVDSIPIVLLFSDGSANNDNDANDAAATSHQIRNFGAQVFVVGLLNNDFQQAPLEAIASSSDTLRMAPSSIELVNLFKDIGEIVNSYVLRDVRYVEPLASDNLDVMLPISTDSQESLTLGPTGISLQFDAMTRQDAANFGGFHYQIAPKRYGLVEATTAEATLDLVACSAQAIHQVLAVGPALLVLPPLPFVAPIPLLLLFLAGLPWFFGRRRKPKPSTPPERPLPSSERPLPPPMDPPLLTWLRKAEDLAEQGGVTTAGLTDTPQLIIGLGDAGRIVIQQIVERLSERVGDQWPTNLRLLHIAVANNDSKLSAQQELPRTVEQVLLRRNIGRQNVEGDHMAWSQGNSSSPRGRGRMALFTDLSHGKGESLLWEPLGRVLTNQKNITVWIVSDGFGPASGMIADVAHLIRVRVNGEIINSVRLCLATHNADWSGITTQSGKEESSFATIRELQRLQSNDETPFIYTAMQGQPELRAVHTGKLFDEIYLFDGHGEGLDEVPYDISKLPASKGVLRVIANAMLALLETPLATAFYLNEKNAQSSVSRGGAVDLESYGSVMGCAVVQAPIEQSRRLAELRLLHRALFNPSHGIFGWGNLDAEDNQTATAVTEISLSAEDRNAFHREVAVSNQSAVQFQQLLLEFLMRRMNDGRPLALRWAEVMLAWIPTQGSYPPVPLQAMRGEVQRWLQNLGSAPDSNPAMTVPSGGAPLASFSFNTPSTSSSAANVSTAKISMIQQWQNAWEAALNSFPRAGENEPEQIAWSIAEERDVFKRYLGSESERIATRIRQRTFWHWTGQPAPQLRMLILPPVALSAPHANGGTFADDIYHKPHYYSVGSDEPATLMRQLMGAVRPFSQVLRQESDVLARMLQSVAVQKRLNENASPLYAQVERGRERIASSYLRYLLTPPSLTSNLSGVQASHRLTGSDPTICILLHAQHTVRFGNMRSYSEARSAYQADPDLFVFLAEKEAARRERAARTWAARNQSLILSPAGTALLDRNVEIFDQVGKLFVCGELELSEQDGTWRVEGGQATVQPFCGSVGGLLDKMVGIGSMMAQQTAIRGLLQERTQTTSRRARLQTQLPALAASQNSNERDVAILIAWALENPE